MDERERRYYQGLYEIAAAVNSAGSPESVLQGIVEHAAKAFGAKGCSLMLLTHDSKELVHTADYGLSDRYVRKGPVSADRSIAGALSGRPVAVLDATEDDRIQYRKQAKEEGIASILSLPVMLKKDVIGVMRVYTGQKRHFTDADIHFLSAVANLGAIALDNARLCESLRKEYEQLKRRLPKEKPTQEEECAPCESVGPPYTPISPV